MGSFFFFFFFFFYFFLKKKIIIICLSTAPFDLLFSGNVTVILRLNSVTITRVVSTQSYCIDFDTVRSVIYTIIPNAQWFTATFPCMHHTIIPKSKRAGREDGQVLINYTNLNIGLGYMHLNLC
jgi:hypothetical protein